MISSEAVVARHVPAHVRRWERVRSVAPELGVLVALTAVAVALQWAAAVYRSEVGHHPDEGAHFVTGLMVRDFLVAPDHRAPLRFAENYYLHYPRVALGHWPPLFYILLAPCMLLFGATPAAVHGLIALLAALLGFLLYRAVAARHGRVAGLAAAALMLATPLLTESTGDIMADILVGLTALAAALFFARYLQTERLRDALWFGAFVLLALQTKGNAIGLAAVPAVAIPLARRWRAFTRAHLWLAALLVLAGSAPWYLITRQMATSGTLVQDAPSFAYAVSALRYYSTVLFTMAGPLFGLAAAVGIAVRVAHPLWRGFPVRPLEASMIGLLVGMLWVVCIVPTGFNARMLVPAAPALLLFAVEGVVWTASALPKLRQNPKAGAALLGAVPVLAFLVGSFQLVTRANSGFGAPNAQVLVPTLGQKPVVLLATDQTGESMMLSDLVQREARPGHFVLRASKVLADQTWVGGDYSLRYHSPAEVLAYLDSVPVDYVIADSSPNALSRRDHLDLLERTIREAPDRWREVGRFPRVREGRAWPDALRVYEFIHPPRTGIHIRIDQRRTLNRQIKTAE